MNFYIMYAIQQYVFQYLLQKVFSCFQDSAWLFLIQKLCDLAISEKHYMSLAFFMPKSVFSRKDHNYNMIRQQLNDLVERLKDPKLVYQRWLLNATLNCIKMLIFIGARLTESLCVFSFSYQQAISSSSSESIGGGSSGRIRKFKSPPLFLLGLPSNLGMSNFIIDFV